MPVACVSEVELKHPRPEVIDGSIWTPRSVFQRRVGYLALEDTVLKCRKSQTDISHDEYDLLNCTCRRGKRPGEILLLNNKGRRVFSFIVQDNDVDAWLFKLSYACTWALEKHYVLGPVIGKGGFGNVYKATNNAGEEVAVKVIEVERLPPRDRKFITKEMEILPSLRHPNIVKTHDIFVDKVKRKISIAMELLSGGDLLDYIRANGPLREESAKIVMKQLFSVLRYLHDMDIVHRDLKPENILLRGNGKGLQIAVTDFGFADHVTSEGIIVVHEDLQCSGGTIGYMAPETSLSHVQTTAIDMWACGVILYVLLSSRKPFVGSREEIVVKSLAGNFVFHRDNFCRVSEEAKSLIKSLLHVVPHVRLTAHSVVYHKWFTSTSYFKKDSATLRSIDRLKRAVHAIVFVRSWMDRCNNRPRNRRGPLSSLNVRQCQNTARSLSSSEKTPMDIAFRNTAEAE
eukprot:Plantae.Rhodophyta-Purpureofilum_apyrenoidigerum.ctg2341.p1 GENE.Plantae.Rhodophyta-Purpureofilum_apyrenoidigerum.ctg2341~~Plantae.Rhodophyta-Purpureofilum_apyrenoidigerum.ctg2341.p1  ORF type:complete len:458 (-),score=72.01 Plantae.Rhodophyta-Purpureofilum_apyrenoidigerum.ctg2341:762-2135(-)